MVAELSEFVRGSSRAILIELRIITIKMKLSNRLCSTMAWHNNEIFLHKKTFTSEIVLLI